MAAKAEPIDPKVIKIAAVLLIGALAVVFDTTIVSVALRTLAADLHTDVTTVHSSSFEQWISDGEERTLRAIELALFAELRSLT